jgi:ubiquinone/menaquinone biosynthesis C-methylase UbiE
MVDDKGDSAGMAADANSYSQALSVSNPLREPVIRSAIQALQLPLGSRGLDAGCGIGLQAILLAKEVGSAGHVTGLDLSPELLVYAKENVEKAGLAEQITFKEGSVAELPFDDHTFDWAWSMDCVGYLPLEPQPLLLELSRVVKPGGLVAITAWSSEKLLPGHPQLEARLNATTPGIAPFAAGKKPELHFLRALGWFREAGLEEPTAQTFAGDAYAPLTDDLRRALESLFQMRWPGVKEELAREDWEEYQRLCLPESPDFILNRPDYYAFFTYSMFSGFVAG